MTNASDQIDRLLLAAAILERQAVQLRRLALIEADERHSALANIRTQVQAVLDDAIKEDEDAT